MTTTHECHDYWETTGNIRVHHTCHHHTETS